MTEPHGAAHHSSPEARRQREQRLRRAVLRGDESAWRAWYDETFAVLLAFVQWRCGGRHDWVEEVVQETWLIAVRRIRAFDPGQGAFVNWVRGIAANVIRNLLHRRGRTTCQSLERIDPPMRDDREANERAERIAVALNALPERQEAVLRAKYLEQRSVSEIALALGESEKAVESLLTRARAAFRHNRVQQAADLRRDCKSRA